MLRFRKALGKKKKKGEKRGKNYRRDIPGQTWKFYDFLTGLIPGFTRNQNPRISGKSWDKKNEWNLTCDDHKHDEHECVHGNSR